MFEKVHVNVGSHSPLRTTEGHSRRRRAAGLRDAGHDVCDGQAQSTLVKGKRRVAGICTTR